MNFKVFHQHRDEEAAKMLEVSLQFSGYAPQMLREALMCDAAIFQARRRARVDLAQRWLEGIPTNPARPWFRPRVEAAILEGQGDTAGALGKLAEVEKLLRAAPNQAHREISLRYLERWRSELSGPA